MNNEVVSNAGLLIDLKKRRIRIHRNTMQILGEPSYVMLLVNPKERALALMCSAGEQKCAHKVPAPRKNGRQEYEFYSKDLVHCLSQLNGQWQEPDKYRMKGEYIPNEHMFIFRMDQAERIGA